MPDAPPLEIDTYAIDPRALKLLDRNARRMPAREFNQLIANIKRDGALTSTPLVHRAGDDLTVLSGNHRVKAAIAAGMAAVSVLEVKGDGLTPERLLAIQLSHNALVGEDDQNILRELYDSLGVLEKLYSGLTDASFGAVDDLDLTKLAIGAPTYEHVSLMFLPEDREVFMEAMEQLGRGAARTKRFIGRLDDYRRFEQALVAVQDTLNIHNQALALAAMAELALERLEEMEMADGHRNAGDAAQEEHLQPSEI